jgi:CDGSH-type Zn-finger protein
MEICPRERSAPRPGHTLHVCSICGKSSEKTICDQCSERLHFEALARKKHEEQGDAWSHWE